MFKKNKSQKDDLGVIGKIAVGFMLALLILSSVTFFLVLYFFGFAGIFIIVGIEYYSFKLLIVFSLWFLGVGIIFELVFKGVFFLVIANINRYKIYLYILVDVIAGWLALFTVDELITGITISAPQEMIIAIILSLTEFAFKDKEEGKD
ncbi:YrvL family regulatory protein [Oceanobacillus jordanicus]|uniref:Regulatory YrvL family protein n=1 Tax=Oceanobacillus jordanicus TaxID=2867266 RepID=A0AAW5B4Z6_9BACI|nr:YrvL family regulatory protein [Oceanobacillus jordanicus]MCG3418623.1 regulatory YrvL family protein [Oceanobacillus jordanicus]